MQNLRDVSELLPVFRALGLDEGAAAIYFGLVTEPTENDGRPAGRASADVAPLIGLGLVVRDDQQRLRARRPSVALAAVIHRQLGELSLAHEAVDRLEHLYRLHHPDTAVGEVLAGEEAIRFAGENVLGLASRELIAVAGVTPLPGRWCTLVEERLRRGVHLRLVYARPALAAADGLASLQTLVAAGAQARTLPTVDIALIAADELAAVLVLSPAADVRPTAEGVCLTASAAVAGVRHLFEVVWRQAWPLALGPAGASSVPEGTGVRQEASDVELSDQDSLLLNLVAAGLKDEAIGRQLRMGTRTVQRRLAKLMIHLGTTNRLELVRTASQRGLV